MIRFIWSNWLRNKRKLILLLVGILIISTGLSFLVSLSEVNQVKVNETLNESTPSYHIIVRPEGTRSITEEKGLLEPNYLTGNTGGITKEQLEQIRSINDVDIAAPMSVIGYVDYSIFWEEINPYDLEEGIYRITETTTSNNGIEDEIVNERVFYYKKDTNNKSSAVIGNLLNVRGFYSFNNALLVGIDPKAEGNLVGLDTATIINNGKSRYFNNYDKGEIVQEYTKTDLGFIPKKVSLPILNSDKLFYNQDYIFKLERLDIPLDDEEFTRIKTEADELGDFDSDEYRYKLSKDTYEYLETKDAIAKDSYIVTYNDSDLKDDYLYTSYQKFREDLRVVEKGSVEIALSKVASYAIPYDYQEVESPYLDKWEHAYRLKSFNEDDYYFLQLSGEWYKPIWDHRTEMWELLDKIHLEPEYIGTYETDKLNIAKEQVTNQLIDTYRSTTAKLVLDSNNKPVNPPKELNQAYNPVGYLSTPPQLLTTIDAAEKILGDKYISSIRIKVKGVKELNNSNIEKVEQVAKEIEEQTGLLTDVVFGAAPQPTLLYVDKQDKDLGWLEVIWLKLGAATTIVQEFTMGYTGLFYSLVLVPVIYIIATYFISYLARRKEMAILLATGWRQTDLVKMILIESIIIGSLMAFISWGVIGAVTLLNVINISPPKFLLVGLIAFLISILGAILPSIQASRITPYDAMKTGEINKGKRFIRTEGLLSMGLSGLFRRILRNLFSIISIAIPTMLLIFFVFITFRLDGVFHQSWLGQYVAMEIGSTHYIGIGIALGISILTTAQIIWQNVDERRGELALLKSVGWRNSSIRKLIILEGFFVGLVSAILGIVLGLLMINSIYNNVSISDLKLYLLIGLIPILIGIISSILPAQNAAKQDPLQGLRGKFSTNKKTSKILTISLGTLGSLILVTAIIFTFQVVANYMSTVDVDKTMDKAAVEQENASQNNIDITSSESNDDSAKIGDLMNFEPSFVANENKATYEIDFEMHPSGQFDVNTRIEVENLSNETWDEMRFYFIPNVFTKENRDKLELNNLVGYSEIDIREVKVNGEKASYDLNFDTLTVNLKDGMNPEDTYNVEINYSFKMPEQGVRFSRADTDYHLAQWYPMLATYRNGKWNKEDFDPTLESYHTDHSDFTINYKIPEGYTLVSSSDNDSENTVGTLKVENAKEVFIAILKDKQVVSEVVDGVEIRVFGKDDVKNNEGLEIAVESFKYYSENIGAYPYKQLDVIFGGKVFSMEYSGIVTVTERSRLEHVIAHEVGHQWFYGIMSNDPYFHGWIDEGITEIVASLYMYSRNGGSIEESLNLSYRESRVDEMGENYSNLPLSSYDTTVYFYYQPVVELWELFSDYDGVDTAIKFLEDYYNTYAFEEVDTEEFVRFTKNYFNLEDDRYFENWLNY